MLAGLEGFVGPVMEQRVGQRPTDTLVEQDKHESGFGAFVGETVAVAAADAFEQTVSPHFRRS